MSAITLPTLTNLADSFDLEEAARQSAVLSPVSAAILEEVMEKNPLDIVNRARLLGFYYRHYWKRRTTEGKDYRNKRIRQIIWFIENTPDCKFAGDTYLSVDRSYDPNNYAKVSSAWQKALKVDKCADQVLINASLFFFKHDTETSLRLLQTLLNSNPTNVWAKSLLRLRSPEPEAINEIEVEKALSPVSTKEAKRWGRICDDLSLSNLFSEHSRLSIVSARTLERVVSTHADDVIARALLVTFYGARCNRHNLLGYDPEFENEFATHTLWFMSHAPGAEGLSFMRVPDLSQKTRRLLQNVWNDCVKRFPIDVAVQANSEPLRKNFGVRTDAERRAWSRKRRANGGQDNSPGALDRLAIKPNSVVCSAPLPTDVYSLTEWANDSAMQSAALSGALGPCNEEHIIYLNEALDVTSTDLYNRAKIVSFTERKQRSLKLRERDIYYKHLRWLITNVPDCEFLQDRFWDDLKNDTVENSRVRKLWLETVKSHQKNAEVYINAAVAHFPCDRFKAQNFVTAALRLEPENLMALALMDKLKGRRRNGSSESLLDTYVFTPGCKSNAMTKASQRVNTTGIWLHGHNLLRRSLWTMEQVVNNNPNELAMRLELLGFHFNARHCPALSQRDPRLRAGHLPHVLWFIKNTPDQGLMAFESWSDPVAHLAIVDAWKQQIKAYPRNAAVAYSASWAFAVDKRCFKDGIAMLKRSIKLHPRNKKLKDRLKHLRHLDDDYS